MASRPPAPETVNLAVVVAVGAVAAVVLSGIGLTLASALIERTEVSW